MKNVLIPIVIAWFGVWAGAAAADELSPGLRGQYAPGGDCARQPRIIVDARGLHLDTAAGRQAALPVSVCLSCAGGARYDGIQEWVYVVYGKEPTGGGDYMPVIMMFNANEKRGAIEVEADNPFRKPLGAPMTEVVRTRSFQLCRTPAAGAAPASPARTSAAAAPARAPAPAAARPADQFARALAALLPTTAAPAGTFPDWNQLDRSPAIRWAPLPPQSLDQPMDGKHYFRRAGIVTVGGQQVRALAGGARTMVMTFSFRNDGPPLGEANVLQAFRDAGMTVSTARCLTRKGVVAPQWYRLTGGGKRPALLWLAPARGAAQPWEGYKLELEAALPPMTPGERTVYSDTC